MGGAATTAAITFVGKLMGGSAVGAAITAAVVTWAVSRLAERMSRNNLDNTSDFGSGRTQTFREAAAPRHIIYGQSRVGGNISYFDVTDDKRYLHLVISFGGHEVEEIGDIWLDDKVVVQADGTTISKYRDFSVSKTATVQADGTITYSGDFDDAPSPNTIIVIDGFANAANNGAHRIESSLWVGETNTVEVEVETDGLIEETASITITSHYFHVNRHNGAPDQSADTDLVRLSENWTTDHRGRGVAYVYARFRWNRDKWPTGLPNVTAVIKGKRVFDPRDSQTKWTDNAALCASDYLADDLYGYGAEYSTEIADDELIAAANACDEFVRLNRVVDAGDFVVGTTYEIKTVGTTDFTAIGASSNTVGVVFTATGSGSGTGDAYQMERRYTINGRFTTDAEPARNLDRMTQSMAGDLIFSGGRWLFHAGVWRPPEIEITESDMRGPLAISTKLSAQNRVNAVKGTFIGPDNDWIEAGFPAVRNAMYESQDNAEVHWRNLTLNYTDSPSMAQRISKILLEESRQEITLEVPTTLKVVQLRAGDNVEVTNSRMGWDKKPFRVDEWVFDFDQDADGAPILATQLILRETAAGIYDWNSGEETQVDLAPDTNLPDPTAVGPPRNMAVASGTNQLYRKKDGTVITRARVTWDAPKDGFVDSYEVQAKRSNATQWEPEGRPDVDDRQFFIWDVEDDEDYDFRMRSINPYLTHSEWVTIQNHTVVGKTEAPPDVGSLNVTQDGDEVMLGWSRVFIPDIKGYEIRFGERGIADWDDALIVTEIEAGTRTTKADIPPGDWKFFIKAQDTSGNESVQPATRDYEVTTGYQDIHSLQHHDTWPGERVNFDIVASILEPTNAQFAYYAGETVDLEYDEKRRTWAGISLITQNVDEREDYGLISESVTSTEDYRFVVGDEIDATQTLYGSINDAVVNTQNRGLITDAVSSSKNWGDLWAASSPDVEDWGALAKSVPRGDSRVSYQIATRKQGERWVDDEAAITEYGSIKEPATSARNYGLITDSVDATSFHDSIIPWQDWQKGQVLHRYVKQRVLIESAEGDGLLLLRRFLEKVDFEQRTERHSNKSIGVSGTTIMFDKRFHFVPTAVAEVQSEDPLYPVKSNIDEFGVTYTVRDETGNKVAANNISFTVTGV